MTEKVGAVLVVGGGIAGMQSSLDLANSGFKVFLLDNSPVMMGLLFMRDWFCRCRLVNAVCRLLFRKRFAGATTCSGFVFGFQLGCNPGFSAFR